MFAVFMIVASVHSTAFGDAFAASGVLVNRLALRDLRRAVHRCGGEIGASSAAYVASRRDGRSDAGLGAYPRRDDGHGRRLSCRALRAALEPNADAQMLVGTIGGLTAIAGAILGTSQWDIKRILAYSTMSQIGYMIMGVGVGAYEGGVAHFFTHAFFKAQLFLGSGIIIHALANEQDVRRMGGLRKRCRLRSSRCSRACSRFAASRASADSSVKIK